MKLPFDLNLKLVFRLLLPGFILASAFYPILRTVLQQLSLAGQIQTAYIVSALLFGWLTVVMDMHIYMLYEGRRYWPSFLWNGLLKREAARLERAWNDANEGATELIMDEASVELRRFPIDEKTGKFVVRFPTRLGNLLRAFEGYSDLVYGMDSAFYWPRLWLVLDKDLREEVDSLQAMADSTTYASFGFYVSGVLSLGYAALKAWRPAAMDFLPGTGMLLGLGIAGLIMGYWIYRVSLHLQSQFGDIFKSVFDMYRDKVLFADPLAEVGRLTRNKHVEQLPKKQQYRKIWRYLHNYRVKFTEDGESYTPNEVQEILSDRSSQVEQPSGAARGSWPLRLILQILKLFSSAASKTG
jgi:hypothetical protein